MRNCALPLDRNRPFHLQVRPEQRGLPYYGDLIFDSSGDIFGTDLFGGLDSYGGAWELTPSNGGWTQTVIYQQFFGANGQLPYSGVIFDSAGNLYGTVSGAAAYGFGAVYELTHSGSGWAEQVLYPFQNGSDGANPTGGVIFDPSGNLYGTTLDGGSGGGGTVYELSPSHSGWTLATLYSFSGIAGSYAVLTMDASGNLYGTTFLDGAYGYGNAFKLTHSNGSWTYTWLYDFTGGTDGGQPYGQVVLDTNGNLFGTASVGGADGDGVVWEIMP